LEVKFSGRHDDWITLGMQTFYDQAGDIKLKRAAIMPVLNYHLPITAEGNNYISGAFMAGPVSNQFDPTRAKFGDQWVNGGYDPTNPTAQVFERTGKNYFDMAAGLCASGDLSETVHYYAGVGGYHLNNPKVAFYTTNEESTRLNRKWTVTTGLKAETSDNNTIEFYADYYTQGGHNQFMGGALYGAVLKEEEWSQEDPNLKLAIYFGAFYRYNDAFIPVVKMDIYRLGVGLSYDANVSKLTTASHWRGGFELTLSYKAKFTNSSAYSGQVKCLGKGF
jgi:type IX secretion system PorP/SprF family membrane protein